MNQTIFAIQNDQHSPQANTRKSMTAEDHDSEELNIKTKALHPLALPLILPTSFLAPGSAHYFRGEKETSKNIFSMSLPAMASFFSASSVLAMVGAADDIAAFTIPVLIGSASVWLSSWIADMAGALSMPHKKSSLTMKSEVFINVSRIENHYLERLNWASLNGRFFFDKWFMTSQVLTRPNSENYILGLQVDYKVLPHLDVLFGFEYEDHPDDFYTRKRFSSQLKHHSHLGTLGPTLEPFYLDLWIGYYLNIIKYQTRTIQESDIGLLGGFQLDQNLNEHINMIYGYTHDRHGIYGSPSGGFTGPFFTGTKWVILDKYFLQGKIFLGLEKVYELSTGVSW